jgi:hypothetical protein
MEASANCTTKVMRSRVPTPLFSMRTSTSLSHSGTNTLGNYQSLHMKRMRSAYTATPPAIGTVTVARLVDFAGEFIHPGIPRLVVCYGGVPLPSKPRFLLEIGLRELGVCFRWPIGSPRLEGWSGSRRSVQIPSELVFLAHGRLMGVKLTSC